MNESRLFDSQDDIIPFEQIKEYTFKERPVAVPADLRKDRKTAQILMVLDKCSIRAKASMLKLQLFNWAFSSEDSMSRLKRYILLNEQIYRPDMIHLDPAINRAVRFARAEDLVGFDNKGKLVLSSLGKLLVDVIDNDDSLMRQEKNDLKELGKKVTEAKINTIIQELF